MKIIQPSYILAAALVLPLYASAQSSSGVASSPTDRSTNGTYSPSADTASYPANASTSSRTTSASAMDTSVNSVTLSRVSKDAVDSSLTAKDLIDHDVYDRNQQKIGRVVDVVFSDQSTQLASAFPKVVSSSNDSIHSDLGGTTDNASTAGRSSGPNSRYINTASTGGSGPSPSAGLPNQTGGSGSNQSSSVANTSRDNAEGYSSGSRMSTSEPQVVISHGGMMGMGSKELLRAPLSQLRYDASNQHLQLNVSETDVTRVSSNR